jgi:DinB superfamily
MSPARRAASVRDAGSAATARAAVRAGPVAAPDEAAALAARAGDPPAGEWSAREVILHLAAVEEQVWHPRLDSLRTEAVPHWSWVEPGLWSGRGDDTLDGALRAFRAGRMETIDRVERFGETGWRRYGLHATFGRLDVASLLRILADHDKEHLAQLRRLGG